MAEVTVADTICYSSYSHFVQQNRATQHCSGEIEHGRMNYNVSGYSKLEGARRNRNINHLKIYFGNM